MMMPLLAVMDWAGTGSMITGIATVAYALATAALAGAGWVGLSAWRSQVGGTRKLESAQDILAKIYEAQAVGEYILGPWITPQEMERIERGQGETDEDFEIRKIYGVANLRYLEHIETFNELRTLNFVARARLGDDVYKAVKEIVMFPRTIISAGSRVTVAQQTIARYERQGLLGLRVDGNAYNQAQERYQLAYDIYHGLDEANSLEAQLTRHVDNAERLLRNEISKFD